LQDKTTLRTNDDKYAFYFIKLYADVSFTLIVNGSTQVLFEAYLIPIYRTCVAKQHSMLEGSITTLVTISPPCPIFITPIVDLRYKMQITSSSNSMNSMYIYSGWASSDIIKTNELVTVNVPTITFGAVQNFDWEFYHLQNNRRTITELQAIRASLSWNTTLCENCELILDLINAAVTLHPVPKNLELPFEHKTIYHTAQYTYRCIPTNSVVKMCNSLLIRIYILDHQQKTLPQNYYNAATNEILVFVSEDFLPKVDSVMSFKSLSDNRSPTPYYQIKITWLPAGNKPPLYPVEIAFLYGWNFMI